LETTLNIKLFQMSKSGFTNTFITKTECKIADQLGKLEKNKNLKS